MLAAGAILVLGVAVSLGGGLLWRANVRTHERQTFQTNATDVAETLEMQLRRDTDFVATLRGVLTMQPGLSPTGFDRWLHAVEGRRRQIGGLGTLVVDRVPATGLGAFTARRDADPAFRALMGGQVEAVHRSRRASYCLLSAGVASSPYGREIAHRLQGDWCDLSSPIGGYQEGGTTQAALMQSVADTGRRRPGTSGAIAWGWR